MCVTVVGWDVALYRVALTNAWMFITRVLIAKRILVVIDDRRLEKFNNIYIHIISLNCFFFLRFNISVTIYCKYI